MSNLITITTDFGDQFALSQLETVIYRTNPQAKIITFSNSIEPQNISQGAYVIQESSKYAPENSIHIGVIDPGVGSPRKEILITTNKGIFIGPDNGIFYPTISRQKIISVYELEKATINPDSSNTFHGRDIFAQTAALLSTGTKPENLGRKIKPQQLVKLKFQSNQILFIDDYGNLKINNNCCRFAYGQKITLEIKNQKFTIPYLKTFTEIKKGALLAYQGSNHILEIAINHGNAAKYLEAELGQIVKIG